jgi:hypothetical protein
MALNTHEFPVLLANGLRFFTMSFFTGSGAYNNEVADSVAIRM